MKKTERFGVVLLAPCTTFANENVEVTCRVSFSVLIKCKIAVVPGEAFLRGILSGFKPTNHSSSKA